MFKYLVLVSCLAYLVHCKPQDACPPVDPEHPVYIPDDTDCGIFYECVAGVAYKFQCAPGTYYDIENVRCDRNVDCGNRQLSTTTLEPTSAEPTDAPEPDAPTDAPIPDEPTDGPSD